MVSRKRKTGSECPPGGFNTNGKQKKLLESLAFKKGPTLYRRPAKELPDD